MRVLSSPWLYFFILLAVHEVLVRVKNPVANSIGQAVCNVFSGALGYFWPAFAAVVAKGGNKDDGTGLLDDSDLKGPRK